MIKLRPYYLLTDLSTSFQRIGYVVDLEATGSHAVFSLIQRPLVQYPVIP